MIYENCVIIRQVGDCVSTHCHATCAPSRGAFFTVRSLGARYSRLWSVVRGASGVQLQDGALVHGCSLGGSCPL